MEARRRATSLEVFALVGVELLIALLISITPNPEGWLGGLLYAVAYGLPLVLMAAALRSSRRWVVRTAGVAAALFGVYFLAVPIGNWSGYAGGWEEARAVVASIPPIAGCVLVFWAALVQPWSERRQPGT